MSLPAYQKALLDLFYRIKSGQISASDISGTIGEGNLPSSVFADINSSRIVDEAITEAKIADGAVTQAKLAGDVSMVKSIQRDTESGIAGSATGTIPITTVDPLKSIVIANSEHADVVYALKSDGTGIEYSNAATSARTLLWQVVEFL